MARCNSCSAPLPANTNRCLYCFTRSDVDLHAKLPYSIDKLDSKRICPNCDKQLQTVRIKTPEVIAIERCQYCFGLFFDKGELEPVLHSSVSNIFGINHEHIDNINKDRYQKQHKIHYLKCPECRLLMNRVNFAKRSGVVIDRCIIHGTWLNNGELTHLLEWRKAGGELLHQEQVKEDQRKQDLKNYSLPTSKKTSVLRQDVDDTYFLDIVELLAKVLGKIF